MSTAQPRVLDVGAGDNPVPGATDTLDVRECADYQADLNDDWPLTGASVDTVVARHVVEHLEDTAHFFAEAGRVLRDDGILRITVPLGEDAVTDLDHKHEWTYATPEQFCQEQQRPWDPDTEFVLLGRDLKTWLGGPLSRLSPLFRTTEKYWPAWAARRCYAGRLTAVYRRVER